MNKENIMTQSDTSRISKNFIMTLDPKADNFETLVRRARGAARACGRGIRVRGRLGLNNPNRGLYAVDGPLWKCASQDIQLKHSVRVDIYLK
jgi:hypothetical protein